MDTLTEKITYPCQPATEKALLDAIDGASFGLSDYCQELRQLTADIPEDRIPWFSIHALCFLGNADDLCSAALAKAGLQPGAYVSHSGTWLFLIHMEDTVIPTCLDRLGAALETLVLCNTGLPHLEFSSLTTLQTLWIYNNRDLVRISGLAQLSRLAELRLDSSSRLEQLPPLDGLTKLTYLDLSWCSSLTQLPPLDSLTNLTKLRLSGCKKFRELPGELRSMKSLRRLDLGFMNLRDLPDWLPDIAEGFSLLPAHKTGKTKAIVSLYGTTVETIPDMSIFEQPYDVIARWFEERKLGRSRPLNEIKVVFLGDGEAGKSHTIARLMNDSGDPVDYTDQSTPGIVIKHKDYDRNGRQFRVHYWDFGGQEIMHSMHRIFLTGRTMYVILLNARDDTQGDRARYWLHNVKSFAPNAPVLLVLNKIDQNENASVDEPDLRSRYDKLTQVVRLSALNFSPEEFNRAFTDVLLEEIQNTGFLDAQWPINWIQVKEELENMRSHYIMGSAYQDICAKYQVNENQKPLLHWFNDLGISFCCCGEEDYALEDYVILRPDWITNALYIILFNQLKGARNGLIPHKSIYELLKNAHSNPNIRCTLPQAKYTSGDIDYVLRIMRKFSLSFPHGEDHEFLPMLCQQNSMVDVQYYRRDSEVLEFTMEFDYLPNNLLHRLMVERHAELDIANVWRTGARFRHKELGFSAVVVIDGSALRFFIRHTDSMHRPNTYLTMLKANVDRIVAKMGLQPPTCQLVYKLGGKRDEYDFEELKMLQEVGQNQALSKAWRRMIPIVDILNQSAPDGLQNEMLLLTAIQEACGRIQDEPVYRLIKNADGKGYVNGKGMEDLRNRRVRDDLLILLRERYQVCDQSQIGSSGSGKSIGELDLLIRKKNSEPWTIIEALRVDNGTKGSWDDHLDKLLVKYNSRGLSLLYLLTYVDADPESFTKICSGYQTYIPGHNSSQYACIADSLTELNCNNSQSFKAAKCQYTCGGDPVTVYHIFARIPTQDE